MTSHESQMLNDLVRKINGTQLQEKDDDAERLLADGLGRNPDAMYMLAQTVLVQNIALDQAKQQLMQLQQQQAAPQPAKATSFLGSLLGHRDPAPPPPPQFQGQGQYQQVPPQYAQPQYAQPQYAQPPFPAAPAGQPSFLRSAATTAAGVAAGALAFEGVESLIHGGLGGHEGFGGGGFGGWLRWRLRRRGAARGDHQQLLRLARGRERRRLRGRSERAAAGPVRRRRCG